MLLTPAQMKAKLFESRWNFLFFLPEVDASHVYVRAWALGCFHSLYQYPNLSEGAVRDASVDSCAEIKSAPSAAYLNLAEFGGRCWKAMLGVWPQSSLLQ